MTLRMKYKPVTHKDILQKVVKPACRNRSFQDQAMIVSLWCCMGEIIACALVMTFKEH